MGRDAGIGDVDVAGQRRGYEGRAAEIAPDVAAFGGRQHVAVGIEEEHSVVKFVRRQEVGEVGLERRVEHGSLPRIDADELAHQPPGCEVAGAGGVGGDEGVEAARQVLGGVDEVGGLQLLDFEAVFAAEVVEENGHGQKGHRQHQRGHLQRQGQPS